MKKWKFHWLIFFIAWLVYTINMYSNMKYYENICNCLRVIQQDKNRKLKSANCWQRTSLSSEKTNAVNRALWLRSLIWTTDVLILRKTNILWGGWLKQLQCISASEDTVESTKNSSNIHRDYHIAIFISCPVSNLYSHISPLLQY